MAVPGQAFGCPALWDREFDTIQAIPSSTRAEPSRVLQSIAHTLNPLQNARVLDAGCGNARNSIFLTRHGAKVIAVDSSAAALAGARALRSNHSLASQLTLLHAELERRPPFRAGSFDFVLDFYVSCHILDRSQFLEYQQRLQELIHAEGSVVSVQFASDDEYYRGLSRGSAGQVEAATDPANGITKRLFRPGELGDVLCSAGLDPIISPFQFTDTVLGRPFQRRLNIAVIRGPSRP